MKLQEWYWIILVIWIIFGSIGIWIEDKRWRTGGHVVLIILLIILGFLVANSPVKR